MDDRRAGGARLLHRLLRVGQHVGLLHHALHGAMQRTTLRRKVILEFNQHKRSLGRIELHECFSYEMEFAGGIDNRA